MEKFDWSAIMDDFTETFRLDKKERSSIERSPAFKIAAAIPFLATSDYEQIVSTGSVCFGRTFTSFGTPRSRR